MAAHDDKEVNQRLLNEDHVPSRSLLEKPYPHRPPVVKICKDCNNSFSPDEEYFAALLGAVMCGTTVPELQTVNSAKAIFSSNQKVRDQIESCKITKIIDGEEKHEWIPNFTRVHNVLIKNARGHIYFEYGQPLFNDPCHVNACPLQVMNENEFTNFFRADSNSSWPEVASRMLERTVSQIDYVDGWVVVQEGIYRYAITEDFGFCVRIIIREYLAARIAWNEE